MKRAYRYIYGVLIALDQVGNALLFGYPDETLSARAALARRDGRRWACVFCRVMDLLHRDHCTSALRIKRFSIWRRYS